MSKKTRNIIIAVAVLLVLVIGTFVAYKNLAPQPVTGDETIVFEVTHVDGTQKDFTISTDSENLRGALEQEGFLESYWEEFDGGKRKYYHLTRKGIKQLEDKQKEWKVFSKSVDKVLGAQFA